MRIKKVEIGEREYDVVYSLQSFLWFADYIEKTFDEVSEMVSSQDFTERQMIILMYSGLVAGAEHRGKKLKLTLYDFQSAVFDDADLMAEMGKIFQESVALIQEQAEEQEKKMKAKKG